ncbi:MAG: DUF420 domain-containing protein [Bacteroidetes bacterium]|nr:DUF420 domain-containing protein [Bacteroidota bacterium]MBP7255730.1 DUF420 domain-containing protein [Chitinophagales bacterium]
MTNDQKWGSLIIGLSLTVLIVVVLLYSVIPAQPKPSFDIYIFPKINAVLNGSVACLLLMSIYFVKKKKIAYHKICNLTAFVFSSLFLVSYIIFHSFGIKTSYGGEGILKQIYYFILVTHIVLAAVVLPFILFTFYRALSGNIEKHRKIARITFPIWLYVAITGVLVYLFISPFYV